VSHSSRKTAREAARREQKQLDALAEIERRRQRAEGERPADPESRRSKPQTD
jgi:hypothetical protein